MTHYIPEGGNDGAEEEVEEAVRSLVSPRRLSTLVGIATLLCIGITVPIMLIPAWRSSVALVQFESLLALVLALAVLWRALRAEARAQHVERKQ